MTGTCHVRVLSPKKEINPAYAFFEKHLPEWYNAEGKLLCYWKQEGEFYEASGYRVYGHGFG